MNEPLTSNPLVDRLREQANADHWFAPTAWDADVMREAADEIERLSAELASKSTERDLFFASLNEVGAERDRLRAALEWLDRDDGAYLHDWQRGVIRKALAGAAESENDG